MGRPGRPSRFGVTGLYCNARGEFVIDFRYRDLETGKRRRHYEFLGLVDKKTARARLSTVAGWAAVGKLVERVEGKTVREAVDAYLKWCGTNRPNGLKLRSSQLAFALKTLGEDRPVAKVSAHDLERVKTARLEGLKAKWPKRDPLGFNATVNRLVVSVRAAFQKFREWKWFDAGALAELREVELLPEKPGRVRHLTDDEERRLFEALGPDRAVVGAMVLAGLHSGLRQANLVGLKRAWVDLERRVIDLPLTKSGKRHTTYVNDDLAEILKIEMARSESEWVFVVPGSDPPRPYTGNGLRSIWRRAVGRAGIKDLRFHDLRHTTATRLREAGADLDVIRDVLGHATLQMATRYAHLGSSQMRAAMAGLSARGRGSRSDGE